MPRLAATTLSLLFLAGPQAAVPQNSPERLVESVRLGDVDGPTALTQIGEVLVAAGTVIVSQPQELLIRRFLTSGAHAGISGGGGDGPGEFRRITSMRLVGDSLVVVDRSARRITAFTLGGAVLNTWRLPQPPAPPPTFFGGPAFASPRRMAVVWGNAPAAAELDRVPIVLSDSTGIIADTLSFEAWCKRSVCLRLENGGGMAFQRPIHDEPEQTVSSDGRFFVEVRGDQDRTVVTWIDLVTGERTFRRLPAHAVRVPPEVQDSVVERIAGALERVRRSMRPAEVREVLAIPDVLYTPDAMMVGLEHSVWLRRPGFSGDLRTWTKVGKEGDATDFLVPSDVRLVAEGEGMIWGVVFDEYDVNYVVGMRVSGDSPMREK